MGRKHRPAHEKIAILKEVAEARVRRKHGALEECYRQHGVSRQLIHQWESRYGVGGREFVQKFQ